MDTLLRSLQGIGMTAKGLRAPDDPLPSTGTGTATALANSWEAEVLEKPAQPDGLQQNIDRARKSDQSTSHQLSDRAPYATRLRVVLGLSLLLWAAIAFGIAWAL